MAVRKQTTTNASDQLPARFCTAFKQSSKELLAK